jgi:hypothetical protein
MCNWGCMGDVRGIWGMGLRRRFVIKTATSAKPVSELGLFPLFAESWYMGVYTGDILCWIQYLFISFYL